MCFHILYISLIHLTVSYYFSPQCELQLSFCRVFVNLEKEERVRREEEEREGEREERKGEKRRHKGWNREEEAWERRRTGQEVTGGDEERRRQGQKKEGRREQREDWE